MSIARMTRVWASSDPREAADRLMLLALADNANDEGVCWPSIPTLARKCAVHRSNAIRTLERLEAAGHIRVERVAGRVNRYHVLGETRRADATGSAGATGRVNATGAVGATGTRRVGATPPVAPTRPEPSENRQKNPHTNHPRAQAHEEPRAGRSGVMGVGNGRVGTEPPSTPPELPEPAAAGPHVDALVARGVTVGVARRLAAGHGDRIDAALVAFDRARTYGPGWLVRAIENGWATDGTENPRTAVLALVAPSPPEPLRNRRQALDWLSASGLTPSDFAEHFDAVRVEDNGGESVSLYRRRVADASSGVNGSGERQGGEVPS